MSFSPTSPFLRRLALQQEIKHLEVALATTREFYTKHDAFNDIAVAVQEKIRARIEEKREELQGLREE